MLYLLFSFQIHENDPLPKVICHNCLHKLEVFHEFQRSCLKSEESLRTSRNGASHSSFRDNSQDFSEKSEFTPQQRTEKPVYSAFRRSSQDFTEKPASRSVPDFTAELHPVLPKQSSTDSEQVLILESHIDRVFSTAVETKKL